MKKLYLFQIIFAFINKIYCWEQYQYQFPLLTHIRDNRYGYDPEHNALTKLKGNGNFLNQFNNRFVYPISTQNLIKNINNVYTWPHLSSHLNMPFTHQSFDSKRYPQNGQQLPSVDKTNTFSHNTDEILRHLTSGLYGNEIRHSSAYINNLLPHVFYYIAGQNNIDSKIIDDKLQYPLSYNFPKKKLTEKEETITPTKQTTTTTTTTTTTEPIINLFNNLKRKPAIYSPEQEDSEENIKFSPTIHSAENENKNEEQFSKFNAKYNFKYDTVDGTRQETSDENGNIKGSYSYKNEAGRHDLQYIAGPNIGFVVTGGSLAIPNGLDGGATVQALATGAIECGNQMSTVKSDKNENNNDDKFTIDTRIQSSDVNGNINGKYITIVPYGKYEMEYNINSDSKINDC